MATRLDVENSRSYQTEENLMKGLNEKGLTSIPCRFIVCCNSQGRYTAIFMVSEYINAGHGGDIGFAARLGFLSV